MFNATCHIGNTAQLKMMLGLDTKNSKYYKTFFVCLVTEWSPLPGLAAKPACLHYYGIKPVNTINIFFDSQCLDIGKTKDIWYLILNIHISYLCFLA